MKIIQKSITNQLPHEEGNLIVKIFQGDVYVQHPAARCDQTSNCDFHMDQLNNMLRCVK